MDIQSISTGLTAPSLDSRQVSRSLPSTDKTESLDSSKASGTVNDSLAAPKDPASADKKLQKAVADLRDAVEPLARDLRFSVDKDTGRTVVKIIDSSTDKVIRQIPSEEALAIAKDLGEYTKSLGVLVKQQA